MDKFKPNCTTEITDRILVLEENKRKCVFADLQNDIVTKVVGDGFQIAEGFKCDFLVLDHNANEYFVELKGKDIPHALEQLESTIKQLSSTNNILKTAIIVTSRYPSNDTTMQRAKAFFKKKYKVDLLSKNVRMDILIK